MIADGKMGFLSSFVASFFLVSVIFLFFVVYSECACWVFGVGI